MSPVFRIAFVALVILATILLLLYQNPLFYQNLLPHYKLPFDQKPYLPKTVPPHRQPAAHRKPGPKCVSGLYMILARGTGDPHPHGHFRVVADAIIDQNLIPDSKKVAVDYRASMDGGYSASLNEGTLAMGAAVRQYVAACDAVGMRAQVALMGYSQGAQVAMDTVCGMSATRAFSQKSGNCLCLYLRCQVRQRSAEAQTSSRLTRRLRSDSGIAGI